MNLTFDAGVIVGNQLFFSAVYYNALFKFDLLSDEITYVSSFPAIESVPRTLHSKALFHRDKIIFIPEFYSNKVHIYDCTTNEITPIIIPADLNRLYWVSDGFIVENDLWLIPGNFEEKIYKINLQSFQVEPLFSFKEYASGENGIQAFQKNAFLNGRFYMPIVLTDKIIVYDLKSGTIEILETGYEKIVRAYCINDSILFATRNSKVIAYKNNNFIEQKITDPVIKDGIGEYRICEGTDNSIFLFPLFGGKVSKGRLEEGVFSDFYSINEDENKKDLMKVSECRGFAGYSNQNGKNIALTDRGIIEFDGMCYKKRILVYKDANNVIERNHSEIYSEEVSRGLVDFIEWL